MLREYITRLAKRGHKVAVLTKQVRTKGFYPKSYIDGVPVYQFAKLSILFPFVLLQGIFKLHIILNSMKPDLINLHQPFTGLWVLLSPKTWWIPKVYTFHSPSFEEYKIRAQAKAGLWLWKDFNILIRRVTEYICLRSSCKIVVLSDFSKGLLKKYYRIPERKIAIVPGGVDVRRFLPPKDRRNIRRILKVPEDRVFLFTIRSLVPRMGLENLILAIKEIDSKRKIFLIIGGDGPLRKKLEGLVHKLGLEGKVRFEGYIPDEKLPIYFQGADYFILPTRSLEGFGLVTVEALACGTPVLGTPVGAIPEVLSKLDPSLIAKGSNPEHIAELLLRYTSPDKLRELEKLRKKCREVAVQHYDWEKLIDRIEPLFKDLARDHRKYM